MKDKAEFMSNKIYIKLRKSQNKKFNPFKNIYSNIDIWFS